MSYPAKVLNVMIVSPSDVDDYRKKVRDVVHDWNDLHSESLRTVILPVGWESHTHPEMGGSAQSIINRQVLDKCDLIVAIFWTRLGTPTESFDSGSVEEIEKHVAAGKPALVYFCRADIPYSLAQNTNQIRELSAYKEKCASNGLYHEINSLTEFISKFEKHLHRAVVEGFHLELPPVAANSQLSSSNKHVVSVRFEGNTVVSTYDLEQTITTEINTAVSSAGIDRDVKLIQALYSRRGFACIVSDVRHEEDGTLVYVLQEGRISKIEITGLNKVKETTVRNMIFTRPQDRFNIERLQEDIDRINNLGEFSDINYKCVDDPNMPTYLIVRIVLREKSLLSKIVL